MFNVYLEETWLLWNDAGQAYSRQVLGTIPLAWCHVLPLYLFFQLQAKHVKASKLPKARSAFPARLRLAQQRYGSCPRGHLAILAAGREAGLVSLVPCTLEQFHCLLLAWSTSVASHPSCCSISSATGHGSHKLPGLADAGYGMHVQAKVWSVTVTLPAWGPVEVKELAGIHQACCCLTYAVPYRPYFGMQSRSALTFSIPRQHAAHLGPD